LRFQGCDGVQRVIHEGIMLLLVAVVRIDIWMNCILENHQGKNLTSLKHYKL
jgi:hypothetical protein